MGQRWRRVIGLVVILFAVNLVARLVVRITAGKADAATEADSVTEIGLIALVAVGVVVLGATSWWVRRLPMPEAVGELLLASAVGCALSVLVGPFVSAGNPFNDIGHIVAQFGYYLAVCLLGMLLGTLGVMTLGLDVKSQSWKRYVESRPNRPRAIRR